MTIHTTPTAARRRAAGLGLVLALGGLAAAPLAHADVITYDNGRTMKGLTRELPDSPDQLEFTGAQGTIRLQRSRIQNIQKESTAAGWIHIGDDLRQAGRLPDAIGAYKKALDADPASSAAQTQIDAVQAAIAERQKMSRNEALKQIDDLAAQARAAVQQGQFDDAEKLYQKANDLVPSADQKQSLAKQISQMYLAWGRERLDKFDPPGAESKFNLAVEADKDNTEAINELLKLWEGNPQKREQAARIYETILERHPDNQELRKKLGDLYGQMGKTEEMVHHYLELYRQSDKWHGTSMERSLVQGLNKLQAQYARQKDYDKAIKTYQLLASIDPGTDPTAVVYYRYLKQANALKEDDVKGRLQLAQYAEQNGLDQEAQDLYRKLLSNDETHDQALAGLTRYAQRQLAMAQAHYNSGNYSLAATLADQVRKDFPQVSSINDKASELVGKAQVEAANARRQQSEQAENLVRAGDQYYATADQHFQNIFSKERQNMPRLMSDREEAKKYYSLAIQAYSEALRINPQIAANPASLVTVRLNECRQRLAALLQGPTGGLGNNYFNFLANQRDSSNSSQ